MRKVIMIILFQTVLTTMLIAQSSFNWIGITSSDPSMGSNWEGNVAPIITDNLLSDFLIINPNSLNRYPTFTNLSVGDEYEYAIGSITIAPGARLTISGSLYIAGIVNGTTYGTLTIQSSGSSYGMLKCGNISGSNMFVELSLSGGSSAFHYFVPPVQSMTICSYSNPQLIQVKNSLNLTNFNGDLVLFNEPSSIAIKTAGWQYWDGYGSTSKFNTLSNEKGYNIHLTSDDKIRFKGLVNSAQHTFSLSYTSGNAGQGWNLVGNPFPINYNLEWINELMGENDNVGNTVYFTNNGSFQYYNPLTQEGTYESAIIPSMQGFFVLVTASGKSITLPIAGKTFNPGQPRSKGNSDDNKAEQHKKVRLLLTSGSHADETLVFLVDGSTYDFNENWDGIKLFGTTPISSIYSELKGIDYFMKAVANPTSGPVEVPLKVVLNEAGNHSIQITEFDNLEAYKITLKHGDIQVPLSLGTIYNFNSNPGTYSDYSLVFNSILTGVDNPNETLLKTWYRNNYLYINYPSDFKAGKIEINIYDFNGRKVFGNKNLDITPGETKQIQVSLQKGFYLTETITGLKQYKSKIVVY